MSDWLSNNSGGSGNPGVAFDQIGATIVGTIAGEPREVETQHGSRLVVELVATDKSTCTAGENRDAVKAGDEVTLWLKPGAMARAVRDALAEAKAAGLQEGGTLAVSYTGDGERKPGKNPPKLYTAQYVAPTPAVAVGDSLI